MSGERDGTRRGGASPARRAQARKPFRSDHVKANQTLARNAMRRDPRKRRRRAQPGGERRPGRAWAPLRRAGLLDRDKLRKAKGARLATAASGRPRTTHSLSDKSLWPRRGARTRNAAAARAPRPAPREREKAGEARGGGAARARERAGPCTRRIGPERAACPASALADRSCGLHPPTCTRVSSPWALQRGTWIRLGRSRAQTCSRPVEVRRGRPRSSPRR